MANIKGYFSVWLSILLMLLIIGVLVILLVIVRPDAVEINAYRRTVQDQIFITNLLRTPTLNGQLYNVILSDYDKEDFTLSQFYVDEFLKQAFGEYVCFTLIVNDVAMESAHECINAEELDIGFIDVIQQIPLRDEIIEVRLLL